MNYLPILLYKNSVTSSIPQINISLYHSYDKVALQKVLTKQLYCLLTPLSFLFQNISPISILKFLTQVTL